MVLINPPTLPLNRFLHYNSVAGQIAGNGIKNYSREIVRSVECVIIMRNRFRKIRERGGEDGSWLVGRPVFMFLERGFPFKFR